MSLKNLLDLRKKDIQIIERIIFKKRPFHKEIFLTLAVILTASGVIWGISKADNIIENKREVTDKGFSAIGIVSDVSDYSLTISPAKGPAYNESSSYTLNVSNTVKILTNTSDPLSLTDIQIGDKIIVQGVDREGIISINRIISFASRFIDTVDNPRIMEPNIDLGEVATTTLEVATSTATATEKTSTTTGISESVTEISTTTDATSTLSIVETITSTVGDMVDKTRETIQNVIDTVTGSSASTSTEPEVSPVSPDVPLSVQSTPEEVTVVPEVAPSPMSPEAPPTSEPQLIQVDLTPTQ